MIRSWWGVGQGSNLQGGATLQELERLLRLTNFATDS